MEARCHKSLLTLRKYNYTLSDGTSTNSTHTDAADALRKCRYYCSVILWWLMNVQQAETLTEAVPCYNLSVLNREDLNSKVIPTLPQVYMSLHLFPKAGNSWHSSVTNLRLKFPGSLVKNQTSTLWAKEKSSLSKTVTSAVFSVLHWARIISYSVTVDWVSGVCNQNNLCFSG